MVLVTVRGMTSWIESGVIAWMEETRYEDETVLVYFKGVSLTDMRKGLIAQHRPPFAYGSNVAPGEWGDRAPHAQPISRGLRPF